MRNRFQIYISILILVVACVHADADLVPDRVVPYKTFEEGDALTLHIFTPEKLSATEAAPAIVFFFGGGWSGGTPKQFYQQARAFSRSGIIAICAEYRTRKSHGTTPFDCVEDGKSAIRWVRKHAAELGVDPDRIISAGGSAGGHIAACTGIIAGHEAAGEDLKISSLPNAIILYNPVIDTTEEGYGLSRVGQNRKTEISPCHHVKAGIPPSLVFHGTADKTVPFENAERFSRLMTTAGNRCILVPFSGKGHGFFNGSHFRKGNGNTDFNITMEESLTFLEQLGFLQEDSTRPNVLFFAVDDMNDWTSLLKGYGGTVHTPNQERLAKMGVSFTHAQTASPLCCPSRTAMMLGKRPSTTGIYNNGQWWRPHLPEAVSMPMHFRQQGYTVVGSGKIFHHTAGFNPPDQWDDFQRLVFDDDPWFRGAKQNYPWSKHTPNPEGYPFCGMPGVPHEGDWGVIPGKKEADYDDAKTADYAIRFLESKQDKPFFLACGLFRPHLPWYAPQKYFDLYPIDKIKLPEILENDLDDIPPEGQRLSKARRGEFDRIKKSGKWKEAIQAYLASISFADAQLGRVLDALENSEYRDNTIIVFWSDHGWHLGEKNHWHKMTLWEEASRIPFIVVAPELTQPGSTCDSPVDMTAVYPTLLALCNLELKEDLDGISIVPLLRNPSMKWDVPAVTQYFRGQCAVRTERYRYIRYSDGSEELYDHATDPCEWNNLAGDPKYTAVKNAAAKWLPEEWAPNAPAKGAYTFDPHTYRWENRKTKK